MEAVFIRISQLPNILRKKSISQPKIENWRQLPFRWRSIKPESRLKFYTGINSLKLFHRAPYLGQFLYRLDEYPNKMSWQVPFYLLWRNFKFSRFSPLECYYVVMAIRLSISLFSLIVLENLTHLKNKVFLFPVHNIDPIKENQNNCCNKWWHC